MPTPLKITLGLSEQTTFAHMKAFVRHADLGGIQEDDVAVAETDPESGAITGYSFILQGIEPGFR